MSSTTSHGPRWRELFQGAVREAFALANSITKFGIQETRAWEKPMRYVADDNQGNVGAIEFRPDGAIAAISARAPGRALDRARAIELAPAKLRDSLSLISDLPLLQEGLGVSEIFWTVGESIQGPESWDQMCLHGAELFERELLTDVSWMEVGVPHYDLQPDVASLVVGLAARAIVSIPILKLTEPEMALLIPRGSKHENLALNVLTSAGLLKGLHE